MSKKPQPSTLHPNPGVNVGVTLQRLGVALENTVLRESHTSLGVHADDLQLIHLVVSIHLAISTFLLPVSFRSFPWISHPRRAMYLWGSSALTASAIMKHKVTSFIRSESIETQFGELTAVLLTFSQTPILTPFPYLERFPLHSTQSDHWKVPLNWFWFDSIHYLPIISIWNSTCGVLFFKLRVVFSVILWEQCLLLGKHIMFHEQNGNSLRFYSTYTESTLIASFPLWSVAFATFLPVAHTFHIYASCLHLFLTHHPLLPTHHLHKKHSSRAIDPSTHWVRRQDLHVVFHPAMYSRCWQG